MNKTCWNCKHLISEPGSVPPVFCKAYPDKRGISMGILSGNDPHERLFGDEKAPVFFTPKVEEGGAGSGNFGHSGRSGERGGSGSGGGGEAPRSGDQSIKMGDHVRTPQGDHGRVVAAIPIKNTNMSKIMVQLMNRPGFENFMSHQVTKIDAEGDKEAGLKILKKMVTGEEPKPEVVPPATPSNPFEIPYKQGTGEPWSMKGRTSSGGVAGIRTSGSGKGAHSWTHRSPDTHRGAKESLSLAQKVERIRKVSRIKK